MWMGLVETETGHSYLGPDEDLEALIHEAKIDRDAEDPSYVVTHIYIHPYNEETGMPDMDADPAWMWVREE